MFIRLIAAIAVLTLLAALPTRAADVYVRNESGSGNSILWGNPTGPNVQLAPGAGHEYTFGPGISYVVDLLAIPPPIWFADTYMINRGPDNVLVYCDGGVDYQGHYYSGNVTVTPGTTAYLPLGAPSALGCTIWQP
jgi:hypothetical protein